MEDGNADTPCSMMNFPSNAHHSMSMGCMPFPNSMQLVHQRLTHLVTKPFWQIYCFVDVDPDLNPAWTDSGSEATCRLRLLRLQHALRVSTLFEISNLHVSLSHVAMLRNEPVLSSKVMLW